MTLEFATPWALAFLLLIPALAMLPRWANQQFQAGGAVLCERQTDIFDPPPAGSGFAPRLYRRYGCSPWLY